MGTQIDLRGDPGTIQKLSKVKQKPVTVEDAEEVARKVGAVKYVEFSARTQKGLKNAFDEAICAAIGPPELPANEEMPLPEMSDEMQQQQQQPEIRRKKCKMMLQNYTCTRLHLVQLLSQFLMQLYPKYTQKHVINGLSHFAVFLAYRVI